MAFSERFKIAHLGGPGLRCSQSQHLRNLFLGKFQLLSGNSQASVFVLRWAALLVQLDSELCSGDGVPERMCQSTGQLGQEPESLGLRNLPLESFHAFGQLIRRFGSARFNNTVSLQ